MFLMHGDVDGMCQDVCPAFVSLANLIERTVLLPLFRMEPATTDHYFTFFTETFQSFLPELAAHFELLELHPSVYLIDWTYTLFCKLLPPEVSIFVWDRIILHVSTPLLPLPPPRPHCPPRTAPRALPLAHCPALRC